MHLSKICWCLTLLPEIDTVRETGIICYLLLDFICDSLYEAWQVLHPDVSLSILWR